MIKTWTFDPAKLIAMILVIISIFNGSFTLLAVGVLIGMCSLEIKLTR